MISYAAGAAMLQLIGGVCALVSTTGIATCRRPRPRRGANRRTCAESADWYNSKMLAVMGSEPQHDPHARLPLRWPRRGTTARRCGSSRPTSARSRSTPTSGSPSTPDRTAPGGWRSTTSCSRSVTISEKPVPYFIDYTKRYTDAPLLVEISEAEGASGGRVNMLRANRLVRYEGVENRDWKFLMWDAAAGRPKMPMGTVGFRWGKEPGKWNLQLKDGLDGSPIEPTSDLSRRRRQCRRRRVRRLRRRARR